MRFIPIRRFVCGLALCVALTQCGLPPKPTTMEAAENAEFNARFGIPGSMPLEPQRPKGVLEVAVDKVFGDPTEKPRLIKAPPPVPAPRIEPVPRAPRGGGYAWQPSAWEWNGYEFVWVVGFWTLPPANMHWASGHWMLNDEQTWIWITGGWVG